MIKKEQTEIKGLPFPKPTAVQIKVSNRLKRLIKRMQIDINKEIIKLSKSKEAKAYTEATQVYKTVKDGATMDAITFATLSDRTMNALYKKWTGIFNKMTAPFIKNMMLLTDRQSSSAVRNSTKDMPFNSSIASKIIPKPLKISIQASVKESTSLIKSLPDQYISQLQGDIQRNITGQGTSFAKLKESIAKNLKNRNGMVQRRANNIVRDQVNKIYADMNHSRLRSAGVQDFDWQHNGGSKEPRQYHKSVLNGNRYSFNDPPVIDPNTGARGLPGDLIHCNCTSRPVYTQRA